jgi:hypothetical protein
VFIGKFASRTIGFWLFCVVAASCAARADEWRPPGIETSYSQDQSVRFTVTPRGIESPLAYFEGKVKNDKRAGQAAGGAPYARGTLERKSVDGRWSVIWDKRLVNDVAPVSSLLTNSARYVVTFDNWHSMGWGSDVIVIYGPDGSLIRALSLYDVLPDDYFKALPRTVSSIWWSGQHRIAEDKAVLMLKVVIPSNTEDEDKRAYVEVPVDLATGKVLPITDAAWPGALAQAKAIAQKKQADDDAWLAWFKGPLLGPKTTDQWDWIPYLTEAFFRLDPDWRENTDPITSVLPLPNSEQYDSDRRLLHDLLLETPPSAPNLLIASPGSEENLLKVLGEIAREAKPGAWKGRRIYVAISAANRDRLAAIFEPTGANLIHLDPAKPIPQRPERIEEYIRDYNETWHTDVK